LASTEPSARAKPPWRSASPCPLTGTSAWYRPRAETASPSVRRPDCACTAGVAVNAAISNTVASAIPGIRRIERPWALQTRRIVARM